MEDKSCRKSCIVEVPESSPMQEHYINLDLPPVERWRAVGILYKKKIHIILSEFKKIIPEFVFKLVDTFGIMLDSLLPPPYADELRGLAEATQAPVGELFLANFVFDFMSNCTSIIAQTSDRKLLHARNLDIPTEFTSLTPTLRGLIFNGHFQSGGKTLYSAVCFVGSILGTFTGQKPNSFTITLNQRRSGDIWSKILSFLLKSPGAEISLLIRDALADPDINYQGVLNRMMYVPMLSSCYIIIGGTKPGEGAVITRESRGPVKPISNGVWKLDASAGRWFLLQTNNDHWTKPPHLEPSFAYGKFSYEREFVGKRAMEKYGQANLSPQSLIDTLSTNPVFNPGTLHTTVMSAAYPSLYKSWIRYK